MHSFIHPNGRDTLSHELTGVSFGVSFGVPGGSWGVSWGPWGSLGGPLWDPLGHQKWMEKQEQMLFYVSGNAIVKQMSRFVYIIQTSILQVLINPL